MVNNIVQHSKLHLTYIQISKRLRQPLLSSASMNLLGYKNFTFDSNAHSIALFNFDFRQIGTQIFSKSKLNHPLEYLLQCANCF